MAYGAVQVISAKMAQLRLATISPGDAESMTIRVETFFRACDDLMKKRLCANYQLEVRHSLHGVLSNAPR